VIEEDAIAEGLGELGELNHAAGTPSARATTAGTVVMNPSSVGSFTDTLVLV
jgi:hypothetical protein